MGKYGKYGEVFGLFNCLLEFIVKRCCCLCSLGWYVVIQLRWLEVIETRPLLFFDGGGQNRCVGTIIGGAEKLEEESNFCMQGVPGAGVPCAGGGRRVGSKYCKMMDHKMTIWWRCPLYDS